MELLKIRFSWRSAATEAASTKAAASAAVASAFAASASFLLGKDTDRSYFLDLGCNPSINDCCLDVAYTWSLVLLRVRLRVRLDRVRFVRVRLSIAVRSISFLSFRFHVSFSLPLCPCRVS